MSTGHLGAGPRRSSALAVRAGRWTLLVGLAALLGCSGGTSTKATGGSPVRPCRSAQLHGWFGRLDAGAGQRYLPVVLTNVAKVPCAITGYPAVQLIAADGQDIPTRMVHVESGAPIRLVISPGHHVSSVLHWAGIPLSDEAQSGPCEPTPARADVTVPSDAQPLTLNWSFDAVCGYGQIDVRALRAGVPAS